MGERGPAPVPTPILKARGSWRAKVREREGEVQYPAGKPTCPTFLSREGKAEWRRQIGVLERVGVLSDVDRAGLAQWCEAWAEWRRLTEAIEAGFAAEAQRFAQAEAVVTDPTGEGEAPLPPVPFLGGEEWEGLTRARDRASAKLLRWAGQFGFTPSARTRIREQTSEEPEEGETDGDAPPLYKINA